MRNQHNGCMLQLMLAMWAAAVRARQWPLEDRWCCHWSTEETRSLPRLVRCGKKHFLNRISNRCSAREASHAVREAHPWAPPEETVHPAAPRCPPACPENLSGWPAAMARQPEWAQRRGSKARIATPPPAGRRTRGPGRGLLCARLPAAKRKPRTAPQPSIPANSTRSGRVHNQLPVRQPVAPCCSNN